MGSMEPLLDPPLIAELRFYILCFVESITFWMDIYKSIGSDDIKF